MKIQVENLTQAQIDQKGITSWSAWEKEASRFDWYYAVKKHYRFR